MTTKESYNYSQIEKIFYYLLLSYFSLQPFFASYITFDGPAHLYNASLINQLVNNNLINEFVGFNSVLVPNWSGHFLLSFFQRILDPIISERLLLCLIIFLTNFSFRRVVISLGGNVWASWLVFPFVTSFLFFMGFYNFSIAILLMFFFLERYINMFQTNKLGYKNYLLLTFLFISLYFSHLFIFLFTGMLGLFITLYFSIKKDLFKNLTALLAASIFPLFLSVLFLFSQQKGVNEYIPKLDLIRDLLIGRIVTVFGDSEIEVSSNISIIVLLVVLFPLAYYTRLLIKLIYFILASLVICLLMYLLLPNANGYVGYISIRFSLLIFINLIVLISIAYNRISSLKPILIICSIVIALISIRRANKFSVNFREMQPTVNEVLAVSKDIIPNNCIVVLKNKPNYWFFPHLDNYLGVYNKNVFLSNSNYELDLQYFPLIKRGSVTEEKNHFKVLEIEFNPKEINEKAIYHSEFISVIVKR